MLDAAVWQKLTEHYGSREWTLGRLSDFDRQFHTRLSFGELELRLSVSDGVIKNAVLYSDALNAQWVQAVAERLCGCELASALIRDRLSSLPCDEAQTEEFSSYLASAISQ